jgi:hypothetical protein
MLQHENEIGELQLRVDSGTSISRRVTQNIPCFSVEVEEQAKQYASLSLCLLHACFLRRFALNLLKAMCILDTVCWLVCYKCGALKASTI